MPTPIHYLHVYQRPKQGSLFIKRYPAINYQHTISNQGWFDTASCDVAVNSEIEGQRILNQYLGCRVAFYVDNPAQPIWEGLVNRMTFNSGGASYTISLDEMANRVSVVNNAVNNVGSETPLVNDATSQSIYGIKQDQIEFGVDPGTAHRTNLRDTVLAQRAFPQSSYSQANGNRNLVRIECIGMFHTLEWEKLFTVTPVSTTQSYNTAITGILSGLANGSTFFNNADTSQITSVATLTAVQQRGVSAWERLLKLAESGDGTNYWVVGITPTDKNKGTRVLYYRIANLNINYTARQSDGLKPRTQFGRLIPPWLVVPDVGIRVIDTLVGYDTTLQTDLRSTYIQSVQYEANTQSVQWFGTDDTTARAAFMLKRGYKPLSRAFGAPIRQTGT